MSLMALDISREAVLIGFGVIYVTLGLIAVLLVASGGKALVAHPGNDKETPGAGDAEDHPESAP
jgi:hypothetical protein